MVAASVVVVASVDAVHFHLKGARVERPNSADHPSEGLLSNKALRAALDRVLSVEVLPKVASVKVLRVVSDSALKVDSDSALSVGVLDLKADSDRDLRADLDRGLRADLDRDLRVASAGVLKVEVEDLRAASKVVEL